jgi:DNA-binding MarR family transcriptional regulator/N-acetylglutamate synthase-like GNAT family acetyltransferase
LTQACSWSDDVLVTDRESKSAPEDPVAAIRHFNRFYTGQIGILREGVYQSSLPLTEVRLLYELAYRPETTAKQLSSDLRLDAGYLSRIFAKFEKNGWLKKVQSSSDRRQALLSLTRQGVAALRPMEKVSNEQVREMLATLSPDAQQQLVAAMRQIEQILDSPARDRSAFLLRPHQPGDLGWIVSRHGALYWNEYRYDQRFEAMVAGVIAEFIKNFDQKRDCCWIAERDGQRAGSVILTHESAKTAKLRALFVEPFARGYGIGRRLVQECIRFGEQADYQEITLWTQRELEAARRIYQQEHFQLMKQEPYQDWGRGDLMAETWKLDLKSSGKSTTH